MSHSYDTHTYIADPGQLPSPLDSREQLSALRTAAFLEQKAAPETLVYMSGTTRSGWAIYTTKALLEAVGVKSLEFLSDQGQYKFETEHDFTVITILEPAALPGVASDLRRLIERVREDPMLALDADTDSSMFGVDEIMAAVSRDYVSSMPAFDYKNVRGDEGQGADYYFTWLRSILRVIEVAISRGHAVVHELKA